MHTSRSTPRAAARGRRRAGAMAWGLIFGVTSLLLLPATAWYALRTIVWSSKETGAVMHRVERGEFVQEIIVRGNVESTDNVEVKCEVSGMGEGTSILWVIPEGTHVEPVPYWEPDPKTPDEDPPDLLVKLDASARKTRRIQQQISCNTALAEVILARNDLENARSMLKEYVEGTYPLEEQRIDQRVSETLDSYRRARSFLEDSESLLAKGYLTAPQIEADRFAVEKARRVWEAASTGLRVLRDYSRPKFVKSRQSDIAINIARVEAVEQIYRIEMEELAWIEWEIEMCSIRAPAAGQVIYANKRTPSGKEVVIEAGGIANRNQVLIRLLESNKMRINAYVNEASIAALREGMPVTIHLDAFEDVELTGSVQTVNEYPEPSSRFTAGVNRYKITIGIDELLADEAHSPLELRPGMTAEATIRLRTLPDVIQVPVQAVFEHAGKHYCVQPDDESFGLREVSLGPTNDETVVILEGPEAGEQVVMGAASYYRNRLDPFRSMPETPDGPRAHRVERGEFVLEITERGNVESAENVEIKCEAHGQGMRGSLILWVIPEGTYVEPVPDWEPDPNNPDEDPPDLLVKLDASLLEDRRIQQQIWNSTSKAVVIRARNELEKARITLEEYLEGRFEQEKQMIESQMFVAQEDYSRARQYLEHEELMRAKGYVSELEVQSDRFAVERARNSGELARSNLRVLEDYSRPKTEKFLRSAIEIAVTRLRSEENKHQLNLERLALIEDQITKCMIRAPAAGQVVYNHAKSILGQPIIIEEGNYVRNKQTVIRLPNPAKMQIKALINEANVATVQEGMSARIRLDAFRDVELTGSVRSVNEYPQASSLVDGAVPEYETTIEIDKLLAGEAGGPLALRSGMTAVVKIRVRTLPDVIQVPVQAVFEQGGKYYCLQPDDESLSLREVTLGPTNDETVVIREGLEAGEQVVMEAASYRHELSPGQFPTEAPGEQPSTGRHANIVW